jgi:CubicO group peptidase (beta-lactamase class C family)
VEATGIRNGGEAARPRPETFQTRPRHHGVCDYSCSAARCSGALRPGFEAVADVLADNLRTGRVIGALIGVYSAGRAVVQIWGGLAEPGRGIAWAEHTLTPLASITRR